MFLKLWYHNSESMISLLRDIIDIWYHRQYHMQNHIWYHEIKTMISYFCIYDISNSWYHRPMISHMITSMISPMISQSIPTLTQFCKQMISMWVYRIAQRAELGRGEEWNLTLARSGKLRNELWKSWMACALRPALRWQRLHGQGWWCRRIAVGPLRRDELSTTLEVKQAACHRGVEKKMVMIRARRRARGGYLRLRAQKSLHSAGLPAAQLYWIPSSCIHRAFSYGFRGARAQVPARAQAKLGRMNRGKTGDGGGQCVPRRSKIFCWLGCSRFWSTVVSPSFSDSFFSNRTFDWKLPASPIKKISW